MTARSRTSKKAAGMSIPECPDCVAGDRGPGEVRKAVPLGEGNDMADPEVTLRTCLICGWRDDGKGESVDVELSTKDKETKQAEYAARSDAANQGRPEDV